MQSLANQITLIPNGIMHPNEQGMDSFSTRAHENRGKAAHPGKTVDSWIDQ